MVYWEEGSCLHRALNIVVIPDFVDSSVVAAKVDRAIVEVCAECALNLRCGVRRVARGRDTSSSKPVICRQCLEGIDSSVEEVRDLIARLVVAVAFGVEGRHACSVLAPFMLPEALRGATVGGPVGVHVVNQILTPFGLEDLGDVGVLTSQIASGFVSAIAVVWPESMDGP